MITTKEYMAHIITPQTIVIVFDDGAPVSILSDNARFQMIADLLHEKRFDEIPYAVDKALHISESTKGKFNVVDGVVVIDGIELPPALSDKLIDFVDAGRETMALENFWDNLRDNPTESSREDLFSFIQANDIPLTSDGCFVCYKKVKDDFWDSYTGETHLNEPGRIIRMNRQDVDQNRENTCSAGLHVAAFEYASGFSGTRLLEVKINPRDVVAVPPDYSNQKMRVCRYEVLRETTEKYVDVLSYSEPHDLGRLTEDKSDGLQVLPDKEGRLRIPGKMVRKLGAGVGAHLEAIVSVQGSGRVVLQNISDESDHYDWCVYTVRDDNAVRISRIILKSAGIDGNSVYNVTVEGNTLVVEPFIDNENEDW